MRTPRWIAAVAIFVASPAFAQTSDEALAESLFREGRRLMADGSFTAACAKLQASRELDPQLGTLLNLAKCLEKDGRTASAWAAFTELANLAARAGQDARARYARERVDLLEPKLSFVTLSVVSPVPEQTVFVDDKRILTPAYGTPLPLDPGPRRIRSEAPHHEPWSTTLELEASEQRRVEVPKLEPTSPPRPEPTPPERPATTPPVPVLTERPAPHSPIPPGPAPGLSAESSILWPVTYTAFAFGGAGLVVGGITGGLALSTGGSLDCREGQCPASEEDDLSKATTLANASNVAFAIGGAVTVLGLVTMIIALDEESVSEVSVDREGLIVHF